MFIILIAVTVAIVIGIAVIVVLTVLRAIVKRPASIMRSYEGAARGQRLQRTPA